MKTPILDSTEWNMSHFFHLLKSIKFPDNMPISKVRKEADSLLAIRIKVSLTKISTVGIEVLDYVHVSGIIMVQFSESILVFKAFFTLLM